MGRAPTLAGNTWPGGAPRADPSVLLDFVAVVRHELRDLRPRDIIDIQSFLWVQGSDEYPG
ncbi:MAG: hypothetical protein QOG55_1507 [Acidobacteriaceae bacterium]|jgi:hypothetical protein|nr:hypothetical protein [Acidobacteriaceae bacterium]